MTNSTLIINIKTVYGLHSKPFLFKKGTAMSVVDTLNNAYILVEDNVIHSFGPMSEVPERSDTVIDASGCLVLPAWCDSHSHIVYAASRENEYVQRLKGMTYEQISKSGGGILNSAEKLHHTAEEQLIISAASRLDEVISTGTGAIEIKSGYGLSTEDEIKMLRVIRHLKSESPATIKTSFLGAHAVPLRYKNNRKEYIKLIINNMIPKVAGEGLADYCDVFCDKGFFTPDETDTILKAAARYGLSVDHLECIGDEEIEVLKNSNTIPTVLPSCSFFLNIPYAPARRMIDSGLGVAIATDFNPGSSPSGNIPLLMAMACNNMRLTPNETFNGVTINGACALELSESHGSISQGKIANLIITKKIPSLDYFIYSFGSDHIQSVMLNGKIISKKDF